MRESAHSIAGGGRFKGYGWIGLGLILAAESALILQNEYPIARTISVWTTPICWWGYILFVDAVIFRLKGSSLISTRTGEFFLQLPLSIGFWLIFEIYNLHLQNWEYHGLPENLVIRNLGLALSFATIMPGIFQTAELLATLKVFQGFKTSPLRVTNRIVYGGMVLGFLFLIIPLLVSQHHARYLFAFVWTGFVILLDPVVYSSGGNSLLKNLEEGFLERILCLFVAGYICGFLWEFWNYWAAAKWVYIAPFTAGVKIFEMPLAGFFGFGPFAWEYFVMYNFVRLFIRRNTGPC
ncbi:MAG: hypothetical protein NOU37_05220 [Candidatus Brocadiales bacterium]|nr:hypothetical protein [Candidatus Bathyanammoxibius amoris]